MALLKHGLIGLRHDPRLLKLPSYFSLLCIVVGIAWLLILPLDEYSRHTYTSENALLPGQVSTYFGGSEHNVFRAYRHEAASLHMETPDRVAEKLEELFGSQGLKTARQKYHYEAAGQTIAGENVYAILQGPRADATEAVVLMAAWRNMDNVLNQSGVALVLALARYLKRWSLWSKDIIFVVTSDSTAGPQAWVDAYHSAHDPLFVEDLSIKGGALQGAIALDYTAGTGGHRFDKIHMIYDGVNGQLPNLDLFNTIVHIASNTMSIETTVQRMWDHHGTYMDRLSTVFRGMIVQGLGKASGPHSSFIPYHVDAVTLQTVGNGWHDEMSLGKLIESSLRSLNNLLEHLHQSFFFYMLMDAQRFVSIGTYLPAAMLIAINFTISSIMLWLHSGRLSVPKHQTSTPIDARKESQATAVLEHDGEVILVPKAMVETAERQLFVPVVLLCCIYFAGVIPLYLTNTLSSSSLSLVALSVILLTFSAPLLAALALRTFAPTPYKSATLLSCFSLLILGIALSTLSTLNFSLGLIIGLLASPLSFVSVFVLPSQLEEKQASKLMPLLWLAILTLFSPITVIAAGSWILAQYLQSLGQSTSWYDGLLYLFVQAAQAWQIGGTWTCLIVWLIWWPSWVVGVAVAVCEVCGFLEGQGEGVRESLVSAEGSNGKPPTKKGKRK